MDKQLNRMIAMITVLVSAAILGACGPKATPTPSASSNAPANSTSAPVVAAPTVAPTSTPAPTPTTASTVAPTPVSLLDAFTKAQAALTSAKTVRLTSHWTTNSKTVNAVFEYVNPSAYHMKLSDGTEIIVIRDKGVYENKNGKWIKSSLPASALDTIIANINPAAIVDKQRQQLNAKYTPQIGADILNGKPMVTYAYNGIVSLGPNSTITGSVKFWYGVTDGWLYQWSGSDTKGDSGTATIEYNIPISIVAPIP
jgi:hypothetical protein